jgi:WD40 repeat protein
MLCPHCDQDHPAAAQFCPISGNKIILDGCCPECGNPVDPNWLHCGYCGRKLTKIEAKPNQQEVPVFPQTPKPMPPFPETRTGSQKTPWLLIAGGIGVLLIVALVVFNAFLKAASKGDATPSAAIVPSATTAQIINIAPTATILPTASVKAEGRIAFVSDRDGNNEIYIMNIDGSEQVRLTNNPAQDVDPCFSPDGSKIVFDSARDGNWEIYIMNVDGSEQVRLTNNPALDVVPSFSSDGTQIAFESDRDGNYEIYIMNVDGSKQVNLTNNPAVDMLAYFSPDGSAIAFTSDRDGKGEIYIMNVDGSKQVNLTNNPAYDLVPFFSPDGSKIAFVSDRDANFEIYMMNNDGSEQVRLTNNPALEGVPSFSSDGSKIAFHSDRDGNAEIYIMNVDGSEQVNLTNNLANDMGPRFSPSETADPTVSVDPTAKYTQFNRWGLSCDYPSDWVEYSADEVADVKSYLAEQLHTAGMELLELASIVGTNDETTLFISKYQIPSEKTPSEFIQERNDVYAEAMRSGDVTKVNYVKETIVANLPAVEEDVERSNGGRGVTLKIIHGITIFEISFIVNDAAKFQQYSDAINHIVSTINLVKEE